MDRQTKPLSRISATKKNGFFRAYRLFESDQGNLSHIDQLSKIKETKKFLESDSKWRSARSFRINRATPLPGRLRFR